MPTQKLEALRRPPISNTKPDPLREHREMADKINALENYPVKVRIAPPNRKADDENHQKLA